VCSENMTIRGKRQKTRNMCIVKDIFAKVGRPLYLPPAVLCAFAFVKREVTFQRSSSCAEALGHLNRICPIFGSQVNTTRTKGVHAHYLPLSLTQRPICQAQAQLRLAGPAFPISVAGSTSLPLLQSTAQLAKQSNKTTTDTHTRDVGHGPGQ
jgi:hypothetical protein